EAWFFTCINLFATPGLGSIIARHFIQGAAQFMLAIAGFLLLMWWFFQKMRLYYGQISGTDLPPDTGNTTGLLGAALFAAAWLWPLVTSIQIIRSVKEPPMNIPPKIR